MKSPTKEKAAATNGAGEKGGTVEKFEEAATAILAEVGEHRVNEAILLVLSDGIPKYLEHRRQGNEVWDGMFAKIKSIREGGPAAVAPPADRNGGTQGGSSQKGQGGSSQKGGQKGQGGSSQKGGDAGDDKAGGEKSGGSRAAASSSGGNRSGRPKKKSPVTITGNTATARDISGQVVSITLDPADKAKYESLTRRDLIIALANDYGDDGEFSITQAKCFFELMGKGKPQSQLTMMLDAKEVKKLGGGKWSLVDGVEMKGGDESEADDEGDD